LYILFGITAASLPDQWNWRCAIVLTGGLIVYFWLQFDGILWIGRWLGFFRPADLEFSEIAREVAHYWQRPAPSAWLYFLGSANAYALPFARAILVTEKARTLFSPDEMKALAGGFDPHSQYGRFPLLTVPHPRLIGPRLKSQ
jgi:hypothetical protein